MSLIDGWLCASEAFASGYKIGSRLPQGGALAIGAPSSPPEATVGIPVCVRIVLRLLVFGVTSLTLSALGRRALATGLAVVVLNGIVMAVGRVSPSGRLGRRPWMTVEARPD